jgi:hypothetical protein
LDNEFFALWQNIIKQDEEDMLLKLDKGLEAREFLWKNKLDLDGDLAANIKSVDKKFLLMAPYIVSFVGKEYFSKYNEKPIFLWWYHADAIGDGKLTVDIENRICEFNDQGMEGECSLEKMKEEGFLLELGDISGHHK